MSFADADFDVVISSTVLHFARDEEHWRGRVGEMWRVLKPGGVFFARLASGVEVEGQIVRLGEGGITCQMGATTSSWTTRCCWPPGIRWARS